MSPKYTILYFITNWLEFWNSFKCQHLRVIVTPARLDSSFSCEAYEINKNKLKILPINIFIPNKRKGNKKCVYLLIEEIIGQWRSNVVIHSYWYYVSIRDENATIIWSAATEFIFYIITGRKHTKNISASKNNLLIVFKLTFQMLQVRGIIQSCHNFLPCFALFKIDSIRW